MLRVQASYEAKELEIQGKAERANTKSQLECRKSWRRVYRSPAVELDDQIGSDYFFNHFLQFLHYEGEYLSRKRLSINLDFDFNRVAKRCCPSKTNYCYHYRLALQLLPPHLQAPLGPLVTFPALRLPCTGGPLHPWYCTQDT